MIRLRHGLDDGVPRTARNVSKLLDGAISESQVFAAEKMAYKKLKDRTGIHTRRLHAYFNEIAGYQTDEVVATSGMIDDDLLS